MSLQPGARLGPYEVVALLGTGGMGEVYRGRDPRLARDIAIKVLPTAVTADPDRLHRFEQEAKAAAALNHPNILAVYDIGQHNGSPYIVSELLEGQTLRAHLTSASAVARTAGQQPSQRRLPARKAVDYALQMVRGLSAAHDKGITHRDLKPENVFLTTDGQLKILDFGLAKLAEPAAGVDRRADVDDCRRDHARGRARDDRLHVSGAGARSDCRSPLGHLCLRGHVLRDALGTSGVRRRVECRHDDGDSQRASSDALHHRSGACTGAGANRRALPREEPDGSVSVDPRSWIRAGGTVDALWREHGVERYPTAKRELASVGCRRGGDVLTRRGVDPGDQILRAAPTRHWPPCVFKSHRHRTPRLLTPPSRIRSRSRPMGVTWRFPPRMHPERR